MPCKFTYNCIFFSTVVSSYNAPPPFSYNAPPPSYNAPPTFHLKSDFRCTEIVNYYYSVHLKKSHPTMSIFFSFQEGLTLQEMIFCTVIQCDASHTYLHITSSYTFNIQTNKLIYPEQLITFDNFNFFCPIKFEI